MDASRGVAGRDREVLRLSPREVALLDVFPHAGHRVMGRQELQRRIGLTRRGARRCDSLIVQLRRALGPDAIVTVRGRGWRCAGDVVPVEANRRWACPPTPSSCPSSCPTKWWTLPGVAKILRESGST